MSQIEVVIIIEELGGRATSTAISKKAKEKFPQATLFQYVGARLTSLRKSKTVGYDAATREYYIIDHSVLDNRNIVIL